MAICDFCNDECVGTRYPAEAVKAAAASGFRPTGAIASGNAVAQRLGLSDFNMADQWVAQVMADSSDWALCPSCADSLEAHLASNPIPARAPRPPLPPVAPRRRRWRLFGPR
ncbi:hypothetical protein BWI15_34525 [Kribbella sp. ALI-6-A]|uniref:hypothetical protein n=1 Tax=Kribbella sp. ALI-6-A TaxID=1933817 RepID=UPI00097C17DF|nr:hypothetical protein [Kribbella sp. ALI-6-A]ONI68155.1 hypothetical protein BWI15_34525 [Kribbella sp. ALI-6-A]